MAIAACYLAAGVIVSLSPDRHSPQIWPAVMIFMVGFCVGIILFGLRLRAPSRHGQLWYIWGVFAFNAWMALVVGVSIGTRWWASTQLHSRSVPTPRAISPSTASEPAVRFQTI